MIRQHLVFRDALWTCPSCGAQLGSDDEGASLDHADDCGEVAAMEDAIPSEIPGRGPSGEPVRKRPLHQRALEAYSRGELQPMGRAATLHPASDYEQRQPLDVETPQS